MLFCILQSSMNRKLVIHTRTAFLQKALNIILIVFMSLGFSFGWALADNCKGGADCLVCAERPHGHIPVAAADMENTGCLPGGQKSPCGFEASQNPDGFHGIISAVRSYHQPYAGIFAMVSAEFGQTLHPKEYLPQILLSYSDETIPIYLLNQSLLC